MSNNNPSKFRENIARIPPQHVVSNNNRRLDVNYETTVRDDGQNKLPSIQSILGTELHSPLDARQEMSYSSYEQYLKDGALQSNQSTSIEPLFHQSDHHKQLNLSKEVSQHKHLASVRSVPYPATTSASTSYSPIPISVETSTTQTQVSTKSVSIQDSPFVQRREDPHSSQSTSDSKLLQTVSTQKQGEAFLTHFKVRSPSPLFTEDSNNQSSFPPNSSKRAKMKYQDIISYNDKFFVDSYDKNKKRQRETSREYRNRILFQDQSNQSGSNQQGSPPQ